MSLDEIAAGIEVVDEQRDRGVAAVDDTGVDLADPLAEYAPALPCSADQAATVLEAFAAGRSIESAGHEAGIVPVTAAKTLHLLGAEGVSPLSPTGREIVRDWLAGELSRADARALTGAGESEFALAAFVESHDPLEGATELLDRAMAREGDAIVQKRDSLAATMTDATEFF